MKLKLDKEAEKRFDDEFPVIPDNPIEVSVYALGTNNKLKQFIADEKQKSFDEGKKYGLDLVRNSINFNILLREIEDAKRQQLTTSINKLKEI